jgi:hypothetical protein
MIAGLVRVFLVRFNGTKLENIKNVFAGHNREEIRRRMKCGTPRGRQKLPRIL